MEQYIKKPALVTELKRRINNWTIRSEHSPEGQGKDTCTSRVTELNDLLSFLDTLEVKEVDLEKKKMEWIEQLCKYFKANYLYVSGHESFISDFRMYAKNLK